MKLEPRNTKARRFTRSRELIEPEQSRADTFDIQRDVTTNNWDFIARAVESRRGVYKFGTDVKELILLGPDNRTGLDMDKLRVEGKVEALNRLETTLPAVFDSESWGSLCDTLIDLLIIDPTQVEWLKRKLPESVQNTLWDRLTRRTTETTGKLPTALALFLLFPEKRTFIQGKVDQARTQAELDRFFKEPKGGFIMQNSMAYGILFPGTFKPRLTRECWTHALDELGVPRQEVSLSEVAAFYLLSADNVLVDTAGKVITEHAASLPSFGSKKNLPPRPEL